MNTTESRIQEKFLCELWKNQKFNRALETSDEQKIEVNFVGDENTELGGPDFLNARIKIGNFTFIGDVEIENCNSDWKSHGHNINKRFNKVILHVVLKGDSRHNYVYTQDGRRIVSVSLFDFLSEVEKQKLTMADDGSHKFKTNKIPCHQLSELTDEKFKLDFLHELGIARFKKKCEKMIHRIRELIYLSELKIKEPDVRYDLPQSYLERKITFQDLNKKEILEQLFYEDIFEALGYSQNKTIMLKLSQSVNVQFLKSFREDENYVRTIESILFNVGGLMPDLSNLKDEETSEYSRYLAQRWGEIRPKYDGVKYEETDWHFFRLRPQNFPTIRIAGGARILHKIIKYDLINVMLKKFIEIHNHKVLINSVRNLFVIPADGYWVKHFVFDKPAAEDIKYFIGSSRADEILANVILPFVYVYFELTGKKHCSQKILRVLSDVILNTENNLVKEISESLNLIDASKRTVYYQGMIELFRSFCTKDKCSECKIGQKVFI